MGLFCVFFTKAWSTVITRPVQKQSGANNAGTAFDGVGAHAMVRGGRGNVWTGCACDAGGRLALYSRVKTGVEAR